MNHLQRMNGLLSLLSVVTLSCLMGGCSHFQKHEQVQVEHSADANVGEAPLAVDVQNASGTVRIWVDSQEPLAVWATCEGENSNDVRPDWVAAHVSNDSGRPVLRVISESPDGTARPTSLRIRVPSCGGVRVRNTGGLVEIQGLTGAADVQNTMIGRESPSIRITAAAPITTPISARTNNGSINVRLPSGSTGKVRVSAGKGIPVVDGGQNNLRGVLANRHDITAVLNNGENPIDLITENGNAQLWIGR